MKHAFFTFLLLLLFVAGTASLQAQCSVTMGPDVTLTCSNPQGTLVCFPDPSNAVYAWSGPNGFLTTQANPTVTQSGQYTVTITNPANGCTATGTVAVFTDMVTPTVSITGGNISCITPIVTLVATTNGGSIFAWTGPGINQSNQFLQNPTVTSPGSYTVTVTNPANGCTATATVVIAGNTAVPSLTATGGELSCSQPSVTLTAVGTPTPLTYSWVGPGAYTSDTQNPTANDVGNYIVVATAQNGCTASQTVTVTSTGSIPSVPSANIIVTPPSCFGLSNGSISGITPIGGTGPYTFLWNGPAGFAFTTPNIDNLIAGTYTVTFTDNLGCQGVSSIVVTQPAALTAQPTVTPVQCFGGNNGGITLSLGNGSGNYALQWNNGATVLTLQNLTAGNYTLTITDIISGCTLIPPPVTVTQPPPLVLSSFVCENSITAIATGGIQPYQYQWSDGDVTTVIHPQASGQYTVTITDAGACTVTETIFLPPVNTPTCTHITGRVVLDQNDDCLPNLPETGLGAWYMKAVGPNGTFYGVTNAAGHYDIRLIPGDYAVSAVPPAPFYTVCVPSVAVSLLQVGDSLSVDFAVQDVNPDCPAMTVDLSTNVLRRCFPSAYTLHYCNNSPASASDAYVLLTLDPFLTLVSAQKPYTALGNQVYRFELGEVSGFDCSQFQVYVNVSCNAVIGQTHCSEAHIFPDTLCHPVNPLWTGAEVTLRSECTNDSLHFILKNVGNGAMINPLDYIVIEDGIMSRQSQSPPLLPNDSMLVVVPGNGSTWRVEASQAQYFPRQSVPVLSVEGCTTASSFTTGYVQQFAVNDADPYIDVDCTVNVGSYDPNDKQGLPLGYGAAHYIRPGTDLEYLIRFQNTGTDTAFTVVVRDTLAPWLDPTTVRPGGSSNDYQFSITGNGVLIFDFQHILLPDSNVNEAASHGFLKFRVSPRTDVPLETDIRNSAAIYFDFNDPVITNTTVHRIGDNFLTSGLWPPTQAVYQVHITPHPLRDASWLSVQGVPEQGNYRLRIYDATGRPVRELNGASSRFQVDKASLAAGAYMFRIDLEGGLVGRGVLMVE